jgi:hypothetical protein
MHKKYTIQCSSCLIDREYSSYKTYNIALKQINRVCYKCSANKRKINKIDKLCIDCCKKITNISSVIRCKSCAAKNNNSKKHVKEKIAKSLRIREYTWGDKISKSLINYHTNIKSKENYKNELKNKKIYYNEVRRITRQQDISNLPNYNKISRGVGEDKYHLDHIISKIEGFKKGIDPNIIGDIKNLRIIKSKDNINKGIIEQRKFSKKN